MLGTDLSGQPQQCFSLNAQTDDRFDVRVTFTSGRRPAIFIFWMCVVGSFWGFFRFLVGFFCCWFFSHLHFLSVPKFCSCDLIYTKQSCKFAVFQFLPSSGDQNGNSSSTLGKGLGCSTCDMKAHELIKSCLRCGKYWSICYSMKLLLNISRRLEKTLGVPESALLLSTKAGWPLFTAVPFWKQSAKYLGIICNFLCKIICKMKKKIGKLKIPF